MRPAVVVVLVLGVLLTGCGGDELTSDEKLDVAKANVDLASLAAYGDKYSESLDDVDRLIAIYRAKPKAEYDGNTMREVLQDAASTLDQYQPDLAAKLDRAAR